MATSKVAIIDTDVFSSLHIDPGGASRRGLPVEAWRDALTGLRVVIAFQTRAEVLAGIRMTNWGQHRVDTAIARLAAAPTVPADHEVIDAYASLTANCRASGHALQAKIHAADRWIAACAIAKELPLLSGDGIYAGAPDLMLL